MLYSLTPDPLLYEASADQLKSAIAMTDRLERIEQMLESLAAKRIEEREARLK